MEEWINEELSTLLNFPVPDDLVKYILEIQNNHELEDYMKTLIDFNDPKHQEFYKELLKNKSTFGGAVTKKKKIKSNKQEISKQGDETKQDGQTGEEGGKKKTKFVNLYSQDGQNAQIILLKGRHHCDCQASKHALINNCLKCGRIVCEQEGSGPCLFCGDLVCTNEEMRQLSSKKQGGKLLKELSSKARPEGWEAALAQRNRLLEYDRTSERRTRVTDDDSDYFSANSVWLNKSEREQLEKYKQKIHEAKHASRLEKKMTFDFAGRRIIEEQNTDKEINEDLINEISTMRSNKFELRSSDSGTITLLPGQFGDRDVAPGYDPNVLVYDPRAESQMKSNDSGTTRLSEKLIGTRIQDAEIQEMVDLGKCMSMHQPWASLLVDGIKKHEGRDWYTNHRGRLWIASAAQQADSDIVKHVENMYSSLYPDVELKFPSFYPTGCLLGCVNVDNCLPQEEYRKIYPQGESDSPFVFICSNPISLRLRFPIKGQHKIYSLEKTIHQAALKSIQKFSRIQK